MANKKNVEANKKNTETKNKKSNELEQKKPTQKKKLRLHSHLKVNIPLFQSLMMILPSLAKHAAAESIDNSSGAADQVTTNSVTEKDVTDDHTTADSSAVALQEAQTSDSDVNATLSASHTPHGSSSHLVPSHHLSTLSHPQVHYIPSVSMPTISSGSNGQPTHSNAPTTPALPVTFMPEVIKGTYGELHVDANGQYTFVLNPNSPQYILLNQHQPGTDHFALHLSNGSSIIVQIPVTGKQDTPSISGDLTGVVTEDHNIDSQGLLHANGKIDVIDPDQNESSVTPEVIAGKYGSLTIDADGHWQYQVDNSLSNVQALTGATSLHESFTIHTKDGTPQTIDMTIGGNDDNAVITGVDAGSTTEETQLQAAGTLTITDKDAGQAHFQDGDIAATHGTLHLKADGSWTYDLDNTNPSVQALGTGKAGTTSSLTDTIEVKGADGTTHHITVTVNGTNDGPVLNTISTVTATEGDTTAITGTITSTDTDTGDSATYTTTATAAGFTLNTDGSYTFDPTDAAYNGLADGDTQKITIPVTVTDGSGATQTKNLEITVTGTDDKPVLGAITAQSATEDGSKVSGTITSTDVDAHETAAYTAPTTDGFSLDPTTGAYTFDPSHAAYQHLAAGQDQTVTIPVTVTDQNGGTDTKNLVITVHGTADSAVIAGTNTGSTTEETQLQASGTLTITDKDAGQDHFQSGDIATAHGTLHLKADGSWIYDLDNTNPSVQSLGTGKAGTTSSLTDTIEVKGADGTTHHITVTVNGTNDDPVLNTISAATATEGDTTAITGTITSTDTDTGDSAAYTTTATVAGFSLKADGSYTFDPTDAAYNGLADGDTQKITIPVTVTDGSGATQTKNLEITVTGTNDKPVLGAITAQSATEDGATVTGTITSSDVDAHETAAYTAPNIDGFSLDPTTGAYTFDPSHSAYQHLAAGQDQTVTIPVTVTDKSGATDTNNLLITVHGTNDAAVIGGQDTGSLDEFGSHGSAYADLTNKSPDHHQANSSNLFNEVLSVSGDLSISDPDSGEAAFQNLNGGTTQFNGQYGHLVISEQGHWNYQVNVGNSSSGRTIDALGEGQEITDTIAIHAKDGTSHDIVVTIHGDNDKPYCSSEVQLSSGKEDTTQVLTLTQLLQNTVDVDANDAGLLTIENLHADHGSIAVNTDDTFTFTPDKDYNGSVNFSYDVKDPHGGVTHTGANITLAAVNDAPVLNSITAQSVKEGDTPIHGIITGNDVDKGDHITYGIQTAVAGVNVNPSGTWTFDPTNSAYQHLAEGEKLDLTVTITGTDDHGAVSTTNLLIHLTGTNDSPNVTGTSKGTVTEDLQPSTTGQLQITDVDSGEASFIAASGSTGVGDFKLDTTGQWTYTVKPNIQSLHQGEHFTDSFTVQSKDGTSHQVEVEIQGTDDKPTITGSSQGTVKEDSLAIASGRLTAADLDTGQSGFWAQAHIFSTHNYGQLAIDSDGQWHFTLDSTNSAVQALGENETLNETVTVTTLDGTSHTINILINGTNDKPIVSSWTQLPDGVEDKSVTIKAADLLTHATDVDTSDTLSVTHLQAEHGTLLDNKDGTYTYTPDKDYNGEVRLTYRIEDGHGGEVDSQARFNLAAVGDAAIITGDDKGDVSEHQNPNMSPDYAQPGMAKIWNNTLHESGQLSITDADAGEASFVTHGAGYGYNGQLGKLHITEHGFWSYVVDNANSPSGRTIDALGASETLTDTITVQSKDGTTHDIVITIHGDNDKPYCSSEVRFSNGREDTRQTITKADLLQNTVDVDANDAGKLTIENLHADHGSIAINQNGTFTFTPEHDYTGQVHFTYDVKDAHGGVTQTGANTILAAVGDAAQIGGQDTGSVDEGHGHYFDMSPDYGKSQLTSEALYADGKLTITDPDAGENIFDPKSGGYDYQGQYGRVNLHQDGTWHYMVDIGHNGFTSGTSTTPVGTTIDQLGDGQSLKDTITVYSKDGTSHDIVVTIHGDNDKPYCSSEVQLSSGKEDTVQILTLAQLLQNTVDVDANDVGQLSIENLQTHQGSIAVNTDGSFTFTPNQDYNGDVHFTYDVKDAHGGVTHTGANTTLAAVADAAVIGGKDTGSIDEFGSHGSAYSDLTNKSPDHHQANNSNLFNQILSIKGNLTITDPDSGEAKFQGNMNIKGQYGHLSLFNNGHWVYQVSAGTSASGRAIDKLGEGEALTDTITVHSADGTSHDIVVTIHGDNDCPYCSSEVTLNAGKEDTTQTITVADLLQNTIDVDSNDANLLTIENLHANHGSIAINKDGSFSFTPEKDYNGDVHFTYDVKDAHGGVTHTGATTNLAAVGDAALITGDDKANVHEDALGNQTQYGAGAGGYGYDLTVSGKLDIVDPDQGEDNFPQGHGSSTWYTGDHGGQLIIGATGSWTYNINNAAPSIQRLGLGESMVDTVQVHSADGTTHNIAITIHGTNDVPILAAQSHSITEDGSLLSGTMIATDVDHGDSQIFSISTAVDGLTFNADGSYSFDPSNAAYQHLASGQTQTLTIPVTVTDSAGASDTQDLAITITGTNDASVLAHGLASATVTEDQTSSANQLSSSWQNLAITDVDSTADAAIVQIEVNGVLHQVPADFAMSLQSDHGTFHTTHGTDGHDKWRYTADNTHSEIQGLKDGQSLTDSITLITADGTRIPITATIQGSDDHVIIDTPNAVTASLGTAVEDTKTSISGMLAAHDVDKDDTVHFEVQSTAGQYGTLSVGRDGSWHYDLDPAKANQLTPWDNKAEGFDIVAISSDGSRATQHIQVNVKGTADAAVIGGTDTASIVEDQHVLPSSAQVISVSGSLSINDPDAGQNVFQFSQFGEHALHDPFGGSLHIDPVGNWGYEVNNSALQSLAEGQVEHVVYRVYSVDYTEHDITITVTGTNDVPVLAAQTQSVTEDGTALQGQMQATDADYNSQPLLSFAIANPVDGLTFNSDGSYTFDPSHAAYQHLAAGQDQTITIPVTVKDEVNATSTQNLTITVHGTNDGAIITGQHTSSVTEDSHVASGDILVTQGSLTSTDVDNVDNQFTAESLQTLKDGSTSSGVLQMGKSGTWIYTVKNQDVQSMAAGETKTEIFEVKSIDGTTHDIEVTITGTNDQPDLGVTQTTHSSGTLTETDVDTTDTHQFSVVQGAGQFGTLSVDAQTGAYTYTPSGAVQGMHYHSQQGHYIGVDTFEVKVVDNHGGESSKFITFGAQGIVSAPTGTGTAPTVTTSVPSPAIVTVTAPVTGSNATAANAVTLDLASSSDSGNSQTDNLTNDTTPTIDGHTDIPFSKVTIYDAAHTAIGHGTSDASGNFSITVSAIGDGVHHLTASALDPSAAASTVSSVLDITVDTNIDKTSVDIQASSDSGVLNNDNLTNIHTPILTGVAEANAAISITDETGAVVATTQADSQGHYQVATQSLIEGPHTLTVTATDTAGNTDSASLSLEVDDTAPTISNVNLQTITTRQATFEGKVATDTTQVDIVIKQGSPATVVETLHATLDGKGGYHVSSADLPDGPYVAYIQATDKAGNTSASGQHYDRFTVDTHADAPTISFEITGTDAVYNAAEVAVGAANTITATIHLPNDVDDSSSIEINGQTRLITYSEVQAGKILVELPPGSDLTTMIIDSNGNHSSLVQQTAPDADITVNQLTIVLTNDTGTDGDLITNDGSLIVTGQEANSSIEYSVDSGKTWTNAFTPKTGSNTVEVRQTDTAGNVSTPTSLTFTLDNQASAPVVSLAHDTNIHTDLITSDGALRVTGAEQGASVEYSIDNGQSWSANFNPVEGQNTVQVRQTDTAGNISPSAHLSYILDTHIGSITLDPVAVDNIVNAQEEQHPVHFTGQTNGMDSGDTVCIRLSPTAYYSGTVKADGSFDISVPSYDIQHTLQEGHNNFKVIGYDPAGNQTALTAHTLDLNTRIAALTVQLNNDTGSSDTDNISQDATLTIGGQEIGATIQYSVDGGSTWSDLFTPVEGVNHALVRQVDSTGNISPATSFDFTHDTTKPIFTVNHTQDSNQPEYTISGTASTDTVSMTVDISDDNSHTTIEILHPTLDGNGNWHLTSPYLTDGSYSLNIYGVDKAGNHTSQYHGAVHDSFTIDTHVAPLTIALTHDTGTSGSDLITNDGSLTITGQETGAHVEYSADGGLTWTNTFTPNTGPNTVEVRQTDTVGNTSLPTSFTFILDNQVSAPLIGLTHDTGDSKSDLITNNGALTVVATEANAVVEYSIDNGQHWTSTFSPAEGVNNVQVRQTDGAGNISPSAAISYTLDTNADIRVHAVDTPKGNEIDSIQIYMSQDVTPTSIKLVDEHGNSVDVDPTMQHGFSSSMRSPDHNYLTYRDIDVSTLSGHIHVEVDGVDSAGNTVQDHSGSESVDKAPIPSTGAGSSLQADISVHSLSQPNGDIIETMQLYMTQNMTLTSIKLIDEHGHTVTVDPAIHHDLGASVKQPDHDILAFKDIDVSTLRGHIRVEVDGVDTAGNTVQDHSGSLSVDKVPPAPQVQHDVPDDVDSFTVDLVSDSATDTHFDISSLQGSHMHSEQFNEVTPTTGASAYLDALGISPHVGEGDIQQQALPDDIDIVLAQADQLAAEHDLSIGPDLSDALAQDDHQHSVKHDDDQDNIEHHHVADLPDVDPNS